jgi:hypothetical protein
VLAPLACPPVLLITFVGGGARRWHDLGQPAWYVTFGFLPCAGVVPVLYLLLAPGRTDAEAPSGSPLTLVTVAAVLVGAVGLGILASSVVQVFDDRAAANETMTVRDIRTLISAQTVYRESNGGLYEGNLECLARPSSAGCAPSLPADTLPFIDAALASPEPRYGYRRRFEPGRTTAVDPRSRRGRASAASPTSRCPSPRGRDRSAAIPRGWSASGQTGRTSPPPGASAR